MESRPMPYLPASFGPEGETIAAAAISMCGRLHGRSCRRASTSVNQSDLWVTVSPWRSGRMTERASSCMSRWRKGSMPSITASEGSAPGPTPNIARPRVWWSSCCIRSATM